jgi:hypothetical protein
MAVDTLSVSAAKKATNLVRDARLAILVGLIPILGLIYILRLVQWYLLKRQFPVLIAADAGEYRDLAREFRSALPRLWFVVLFWPLMILFIIGYGYFVM